MKATHIVGAGTIWPINLHLPMETIVEHQTVNHGQPMGFHGMTRPIMEVTHLRIVKVCDFLVVAHVEVSWKRHKETINITSKIRYAEENIH